MLGGRRPRTVAQAAVVAAAPGVQLPLGGDGCAVGAPAGDVHHVLAGLLAGEGGDHLGLLQGPGGEKLLPQRHGLHARLPQSGCPSLESETASPGAVCLRHEGTEASHTSLAPVQRAPNAQPGTREKSGAVLLQTQPKAHGAFLDWPSEPPATQSSHSRAFRD